MVFCESQNHNNINTQTFLPKYRSCKTLCVWQDNKKKTPGRARYLQNPWNKFYLKNNCWWIKWPNMQLLFKFKWIGWKLTILESRPTLTSKIIGGWLQWLDMQILFKFQVNGMKIENFSNTTLVVDLLVDVDLKNNLLVEFRNLKNIYLQISSQSDENWGFQKSHISCWPLSYVDLLV